MTCPFCSMPEDRILYASYSFYMVEDAYPVTSLHTLIITHDHDLLLDNMSPEQVVELFSVVDIAKKRALEKDPTITGFNIGINEGVDAGQTVMHFHLHVIPRRNGDVLDPRGGVRGVIPDKQKY